MIGEVYLVKIDRTIDENTFRYLLGFVQREKKERILRQKVKQKADCMLIGEILAKTVIKKVFGVGFADFSYSERGKPYLPDNTDIHFNISHSGCYVACAVSDKPVGVDVQKIVGYKPDLAKRVCNEPELNRIEDSKDSASEFTKIWTQKEAVLKMRGTGIAGGDIKHCLGINQVHSEKLDGYWVSVCYGDRFGKY